MKKTIAWFTVIVFAALYAYASYADFDGLKDARNQTDSVFASNKAQFGDLYSIGYNPLIKEKIFHSRPTLTAENPAAGKRINLCLVHDSYLGEMFLKSKSQINAAADTIYDIEYPWFRNKANAPVALDTAKTNVLVFEIVERNLYRLDEQIARNLVQIQNRPAAPEQQSAMAQLKYVLYRINKSIFRKELDKNLEFVLFDMKLFSPVQELKSYINYRFFDRMPPEIFVSANKKQLYLSETKKAIEKPIRHADTEKTVRMLNNIHDFYKSKGFDQVYFSIVPDPVAIIEPEASRYNNQIPMIQNSPNLKVPVIDVYDDFKKSKKDLYFKSDTHWNQDGFTIWINKLNNVLRAAPSE